MNKNKFCAFFAVITGLALFAGLSSTASASRAFVRCEATEQSVSDRERTTDESVSPANPAACSARNGGFSSALASLADGTIRLEASVIEKPRFSQGANALGRLDLSFTATEEDTISLLSAELNGNLLAREEASSTRIIFDVELRQANGVLLNEWREEFNESDVRETNGFLSLDRTFGSDGLDAGESYSWIILLSANASGINGATIDFGNTACFGVKASSGSIALDSGVLATPEINSGCTAPAVIPIPPAAWLFGSALAGLGWLQRRRTVSLDSGKLDV